MNTFISKDDVVIIAAIANNGVIGRENKLPFKLKDDMKIFKQLTTGNAVIMGRKTFESMGSKPLPNRNNSIVSSTLPKSIDGKFEVFSNLNSAILANETIDSKPVFIIGGKSMYEEALDMASVMILTHVDSEVEGDVTFPEVTWDKWEQVGVLLEKEADANNEYNFKIVVYHRK